MLERGASRAQAQTKPAGDLGATLHGAKSASLMMLATTNLGSRTRSTTATSSFGQ